MKRWIYVIVVLLIVLLCYASFWAYEQITWNAWIGRLSVINQPGTKVATVLSTMGRPAWAKSARSVDRGFEPRPEVPATAVKAYGYYGMFLLVYPSAYWRAVVFVDKSDEVVGVRIGHS